MIYSDYHVHTNFCDGKDSPEDMIKRAIELGFKEIGLVVHSYTEFDTSFCAMPESMEKFKVEIKALKKKYADKISVKAGIEMDAFSDKKLIDGFDYVIGSVHYFKVGERYFDVDMGKDQLRQSVDTAFGGDFYLAAQNYYKTVGEVVERTGATIIGHFDLITKFIELDPAFDTSSPVYVSAYREAVDKLIPYGVSFEINTGAISRGYRTMPYPSKDIIDYIKEKGGKLILSSDSHAAKTLGFEFDKCIKLLQIGDGLWQSGYT